MSGCQAHIERIGTKEKHFCKPLWCSSSFTRGSTPELSSLTCGAPHAAPAVWVDAAGPGLGRQPWSSWPRTPRSTRSSCLLPCEHRVWGEFSSTACLKSGLRTATMCPSLSCLESVLRHKRCKRTLELVILKRSRSKIHQGWLIPALVKSSL